MSTIVKQMDDKLEWKTEQRRVNDLCPLEINPRKISETQRMKMIESLQRFNLVDIPVIDTNGTIISGHQRLRAMQAIGRGDEMVDCRVPNRKLTVKEIKEYNLLANSHYGEFDFDVLDTDFGDVDFDLVPIDLGKIEFEQSDIFEKAEKKFEKVKAKAAQPEAQEDDFEVPDQVETDIVPGDLFEIGPHRLLCGDSTNSEDVSKLMWGGVFADMIFQDPPYNVKISGIGSAAYKTSIGKIHGEFKMASGEMNEEEFIGFLIIVFKNNFDFSRDGSIHYNCMDWRHVYEISVAIKICYDEFKNLCIWNKDNGGMGSFYRSKHELIFVTKKGKASHINNFMLGETGRYRTNVWDYPIVNSFALQQRENNVCVGNNDNKLHPTVKPLKLVADAILDCSNVGDVIQDLFLGSGTTMAASHQVKRKCYGMEIDPKYCQVIINRMLKLDPSLKIKRNGELWNLPKTN